MPWAGGPIPHFDSLKAQIFLVQASVNQQSRDQQKDRNEIISFLTDIQLNQWHILDSQDSLRRARKGSKIGWTASKVTWLIWNLMFTMISTAPSREVVRIKVLIMLMFNKKEWDVFFFGLNLSLLGH